MSNLDMTMGERYTIRLATLAGPWLWAGFSFRMFIRDFNALNDQAILKWCVMVPLIAFCFAVLAIVTYRQYKEIKRERLERIACALLGTECEYYSKYAFIPINSGTSGYGYSGNIVTQQSGYQSQSITSLIPLILEADDKLS